MGDRFDFLANGLGDPFHFFGLHEDSRQRFQIRMSIGLPDQNPGDNATYLARGLFLDDLREVLFSAALSAPSSDWAVARLSQISSLISTIS